MRTSQIVATTLAVLFVGPRANADPLYTETDLGTSISYQTDPTGYIHGVTDASGTVTYAFDKSPVTMIYDLRMGGSHSGDYSVSTMVNN